MSDTEEGVSKTMVFQVIILVALLGMIGWIIYRIIMLKKKYSPDAYLPELIKSINNNVYDSNTSITYIVAQLEDVDIRLRDVMYALDSDSSLFDTAKSLLIQRETLRQQLIIARYRVQNAILLAIAENQKDITDLRKVDTVASMIQDSFYFNLNKKIYDLSEMIQLFNTTSGDTLDIEESDTFSDHMHRVNKKTNERFTEAFEADTYELTNKMVRLINVELQALDNKYTTLATSINGKLSSIISDQANITQIINSLSASVKSSNAMTESVKNGTYSKEYIDSKLSLINNSISSANLNSLVETNINIGNTLNTLSERITSTQKDINTLATRIDAIKK